MLKASSHISTLHGANPFSQPRHLSQLEQSDPPQLNSESVNENTRAIGNKPLVQQKMVPAAVDDLYNLSGYRFASYPAETCLEETKKSNSASDLADLPDNLQMSKAGLLTQEQNSSKEKKYLGHFQSNV